MADEPPLVPLVVPASSIPDPTKPAPPAPDAIPSPVVSPVRTETPAVLTGGPTALNAPATGKYAENSPLLPMINQSLRDLGIKIDPYVDPSSSLIMNRRPDALAELIARTGKPGPLPLDQVPDIFRPTDLPGGGGPLKPSLGRLGNIFLDYLYKETPMGLAAQAIEAGLSDPLLPRLRREEEARAAANRTFTPPEDIAQIAMTVSQVMGEPLLPALARVGQIREGMNYDYVPGYDIFKDRKITDAGLSSQMHLFYGSMSPNRTEQIIQRVQDKARQADYVERTGSGGAIAEFAAGILGDPLTFLPATLLLKGPALAAKALRGGLTGAEMNLVSIPRSVFGTMGDGLVYAGLTGALSVAERSIENGYDPTKSIEEVIDSLYMPMAISASMAMVISGFSRRTARSLVQRARDPDFLKGTPASGARYVPDDLMGPVIHPSDEAAAGLVSRYDDAATQARRMERTMPGDRFGGPRDQMPFNGVPDQNGNLPPGAFATNYAEVRKAEFAAKPENAPYVKGRVDHEISHDASGSRELTLNGVSRSAAEFPVGHMLETPKGDLWRVNDVGGVKRFELWDKGGAEQAAAEEAVVKPKQRLVDMTFKPGELPRAELETTSEHVAARPGLIEVKPRDMHPDTGVQGGQQAYVVMPDGRIFEISKEFVEQHGLVGDEGAYAAHAAFFSEFGELRNHIVRVTRYGQEIAADSPAEGLTAKQTTTLKRIENTWKREGLPDHFTTTKPEPPEGTGPTTERTGVGLPPAQPAAMPPALPADTKFGREPVGYNSAGEAIYQRKDGSRTIMLEGNRPIEEPINDIGQERGQAFGGSERGERFRLASEAAPGEGSVGAALSPQSLVYQREVLLAQGRMAPTGIGMERWPLSPVHRIFLGESVEAMRAAGDLVSTGGSITVGNTQRIGSAVPIETLIQSNWEHMTLTAVRGMKDDWAEARHANAAASMQTQPTSVDFSGRSDIRRLGAELGDAIKRKFVRGEPGLSYNDYLARVTDGLRNGDADRVADGNTPYINRSIARHREVYETTKQRMLDAGVFDEAYDAAKFDAYAEVRVVKKEADEIKARANIERWPPARERAAEEALMARMEDAEFKAKQAEDQLEKLRQHGPQLNGTAPSYAPRLWDAGTLKAKEEHFIADIAVPWLMTEGGIVDTMEATRIAKEMHTILSKQNPVFERADVKNLFHSVAAPGSAMARTFTIPDELVKEFLIDDAELLLRYHVKQNAVAVEMKRRFGSMDMAEQVAAIEQEYRGQIIAANAGSDVPTEEAIRLTKLMKSDIADIQALRDKLYGTYGAAADPHAWDSRLIRMAKQFANITLLGASGVSSLGDFVRPLMTEGLEAMYGYGLRSLMGDMRGTILKLGKEDMQLAGVGSDLMNNVRALQAADTGDVFGSRGRLEHGLNTANQWMFVANGLNQITEWSKNWANIIIQGKMNKAIMQWGTAGAEELPEVPKGQVRVWYGGKADPNDPNVTHVPVHGDFEVQARTHGEANLWYADVPEDSPWLTRQVTRDVQDSTAPAGTGFTLVGAPGEGKISAFMATRLASLGIDETMARRIALQLKVHGRDFDDLKLANIGKWENDDLALETYKAALNQSVNRTVVTPGVGDRPNILSTELGSLIGQYKSWAIANMTRSLQSGLQEGGSQFWYGAAAAVGFAVIVNELKSRLMYDRSTFDRPATAVIADAVDRSSILGWFTDANRAVETLTGNRLGVKALTGAPATAIDPARAVGTVAGPAAGQAFRAGSVMNDFIAGHPTAKTFSNLRTVLPGSTLPYLDPFYDHLISDGNFRRGMQRSAEKQGRPAP